ncbi:MAG: hypothetical protein AB1468_03710 [Candidatus Micrarchaeota archaeon]
MTFERASREELIARAKGGVREAYFKRDKLLIQTVGAITETDKAANLLFERLREWYGVHFPELSVGEPLKYCELVLNLDKKNPDLDELKKIIGEQKAREIASKAGSSIGADLTPADVDEIKLLANGIIQLYKLREKLDAYQATLAREVCPNLSYLVEPALAARLISKAGGLARLAVLPASTIQVLGAEKALFKHLRSHTRPPKHGVIFQHPYIGNAPKKQRGKIARALATKITIAVKADAYSKHFIAKELKEKFEARVKNIRESAQTAPAQRV